MRLRAWFFMTGALLLIALAPGCDGQSSQTPPGLVAVLDVNRVKEQTGFYAQRQMQMEMMQQQFEAQIQQFQSQTQNAIRLESTAIGRFPSRAQVERVERMRREISLQLDEAYAQFQADMARLDVEMDQQFRQFLQPIAQSVAAQRGLTVVIDKNVLVLSTTSGADITDPVLTELAMAAPPGATPRQGPGPMLPGQPTLPPGGPTGGPAPLGPPPGLLPDPSSRPAPGPMIPGQEP